MSFKSDLEKAYKNKVVGTLDKTVRAVALIVETDLVNNTPVDTGRARANWIPTLNSPANFTNLALSPIGIETVLNSFKTADTILLTNNLPYIQKLNDGSSTQQPAGFVERAVQRGKLAARTVNKVV